MLGPWRPHAQFQAWLEGQILDLLSQREALIKFHIDALEKVYILGLDPLKKFILPLYSSIGRPAVNQQVIFRALILARQYKISTSSFVERLKADDVLAIACVFTPVNTHGVGSFYNLFNRQWIAHTLVKFLREQYKKNSKKLKINKKLSPDNPNTVTDLVDRVPGGKTFAHKPEGLSQ